MLRMEVEEMSEQMYDIGSLRENPNRLYDICTFLLICDDALTWDRNSECYKVFHAVVNSLWGALPPTVTIDQRDPDAISQT